LIEKEQQVFYLIIRFIISGVCFFCFLNLNAQPDFRRACIQANNEDISIQWVPPSDNCNKFEKVYIYGRLNNLAPYSIIDSIASAATNSYIHSQAANQGKTWQYFLLYKLLCNDSSFYSDTLFIDLDQPEKTSIDSVSFDPVSQKYIIGWKANPAIDLMGYSLWESNGNSNNIITNVTDTFFVDVSSSPLSNNKGYRISAFDSCINQSVISEQHRPVFLKMNGNYCKNKITLSWNSYSGSSNISYSVYLKNASGDYVIDTVLYPPVNSIPYELNAGDSIEFFIRVALSNGFSSRSNPVSVSVLDSFNTDSNYIRCVSWNDKNELEIKSLSNTGFFFDSIFLFRERNNHTDLLYGGVASPGFYAYTDKNILDTLTYKYTQKLTDICERNYWSNQGKNMVLKSENGPMQNHIHRWSHYADWSAGVSYYQLEMSSIPDKNSTWNILLNNLNDSNAENSLSEEDTFNTRCYRIKAIENVPNPLKIYSEAISNPMCIIDPPAIYFPNAIHLSGANPLFKPLGISIDKNKSKIRIYSRNGQLIYSSGLHEYWDGTLENKNPAPIGVYIYIAEIYFMDNSKEIFKGNITVLH
jgi:hypothetical protein